MVFTTEYSMAIAVAPRAHTPRRTMIISCFSAFVALTRCCCSWGVAADDYCAGASGINAHSAVPEISNQIL